MGSFKQERAARLQRFNLLFASVAFVSAAVVSTSVAQAETVNAIVRLQEKVPMESLAEAVLNQSGPMTRGYTAAEIRQISAPADADYQELVTQLQAEGFQVVAESPTHLWLSVRGDHQNFERVFGARFQFLGGHQRRAMVAQVPQHLGLIAAVHGLSNSLHLHPKHVKSMLSDTPNGGIQRDAIVKHYKFDALYARGLSGVGQDVAVATYADVNTDVVKHFYQALSLNPLPTVDKVTFNGTPAQDDDSAAETSLDAEFIGMIAPGAAVHVYTSATNDDSGEAQMFTKILDDGKAKIVNYSWGGCEKGLSAEHASEMDKIFARAAAQGVNIMVASGDSGSDSCQDKTTVADWPAAHPSVVAVGGTSLAASGDDFTESAWTGSGGGISGMWKLPAWQSKIGKQYNKRSYPDVSFNADGQASGQPIYISYKGQTGWAIVGGTSMAAPQWSGFLALVNAGRAKKGIASLGFLNPIIYKVNNRSRAELFNDVTSGSNGAYTAGAGWDAVTGWGSMKADTLFDYLVSK